MKYLLHPLLFFGLIITRAQAMNSAHAREVNPKKSTQTKSNKGGCCFCVSKRKVVKQADVIREVPAEFRPTEYPPLSSTTVALYFAVFYKDASRVQKYLAQGADINAKDSNGWSLLHYAVNELDFDCINALLAGKGIDEQAVTPQGISALHILREKSKDCPASKRRDCERLIMYLSRKERSETYLFDVEDFVKQVS